MKMTSTTTETLSPKQIRSQAWDARTVLSLGPKQSKRLKKGLRTQTMKNGKWYEIIPSSAPEVFLANGTRATKTQLKAILRRM